MPRSYISSVRVPNGSLYYIKDEEARQQIAQIGNFSRYLGVATDTPTSTSVTVSYDVDGTTETKTYSTSSTGDTKLKSGDVVTVPNTTTEPYGQEEWIYTEGNPGGWAVLNSVQGILGAFAYASQGTATVSTVSVSGTITTSSTTLTSSSIPVTLTSTSLTGASPIVTTITSGKITYVNGIKAADTKFTGTSSSITVSGTATQSSAAVAIGAYDTVAATLSKVSTSSKLAFQVDNTNGTPVVTAIPSSATASGTSVELTSISDKYVAASAIQPLLTATLNQSATSFLTGGTLSSANLFTATVADGTEVLSFNATDASLTFTSANGLNPSTALTTTSAAAFTSQVIVTGVSKVTNPTITIADPTTTKYVAVIPSNTLVDSVSYSKATGGTVDISADYSTTVNYTPSGTITVSVTTADASAVTGVTTSYGQVMAYTGGDHNHGVSATLTAPSQTITVEPKSNA